MRFTSLLGLCAIEKMFSFKTKLMRLISTKIINKYFLHLAYDKKKVFV